MEGFHGKIAADLNDVSSFDRMNLGTIHHSATGKFVFQQTSCKWCCVDRCLDFIQNMTDCAGMIFMTVGDKDAFDPIFFIFEI